MNITIVVFTNFFKREKKLYSLGDISLPRPISFKLLFNTLLGLFTWTGLWIKLLGWGALAQNPIQTLFMVGPAIGLGYLISRPSAIFNHKTFYKFMWCQIRYTFSPRFWCDMKASSIKNGDKTNGNYTVWVGDSWFDDFWNPLNWKQRFKNNRKNKKNRKKNNINILLY